MTGSALTSRVDYTPFLPRCATDCFASCIVEERPWRVSVCAKLAQVSARNLFAPKPSGAETERLNGRRRICRSRGRERERVEKSAEPAQSPGYIAGRG